MLFHSTRKPYYPEASYPCEQPFIMCISRPIDVNPEFRNPYIVLLCTEPAKQHYIGASIYYPGFDGLLTAW